MALGTKHVLSFSSNGKLFALINEQGILRIWDTETNQLKQEYTPNLHLSGPCTAVTWLTVSPPEEISETPSKKGAKKQRKSSAGTKDVLYLALGTSKGQVSLYSYAEGKVESNLAGEGHSGRITDIVNDNEGNLYTCGEDCQIIAWSLLKGKRIESWNIGNEKPHSLAYCQKSRKLILGCRQIKVFSLELEEIVQTFIGHSSEVDLLNSFELNGEEYVISSSKMERVMSVWKIGKKGVNKAASFNLIMEDVAVCITSRIEGGENLKVASVTRNGVTHLYLIDLNNLKSNKPLKPHVTIEIASDSDTIVEPIPIIAASLDHTIKKDKILMCYGSPNFMVCEQVEPRFDEKIQVLIRQNPKKLGKININKKAEANSGAVLKSVIPIIDHSNVEYKSAVNIPKKKQQNDLPMESRLRSLNLGKEPVTPQAQSKVQLLIQSLHSKDADLLRTVLCTKDANVVQSTLRKLPIEYVQPLVDELTSLLQMKRINIEYAILWLKSLSQTHSSQLLAMGLEDLTEKFGCCIGIIEHRLNCLSELSKFNGRLQLLVSQIKTNIEVEDLDEEDVLVYQDEDSDEEWYKFDNAEKNSKNSDYVSSSEEEMDGVDGDDDDEEDDASEEIEQNGIESDDSDDHRKRNNMDVSDEDDSSNKLRIYNPNDEDDEMN